MTDTLIEGAAGQAKTLYDSIHSQIVKDVKADVRVIGEGSQYEAGFSLIFVPSGDSSPDRPKRQDRPAF